MTTLAGRPLKVSSIVLLLFWVWTASENRLQLVGKIGQWIPMQRGPRRKKRAHCDWKIDGRYF